MSGTERPCDYCDQPAGSPVARHDPGNPASALVGVSHDRCWLRFMNEALAIGSDTMPTGWRR